MFNWYRAMKMSPPGGAPPATSYDDSALVVHVPTLVLWGEKDDALLPGCIDGLERWVPDLKVERLPEGTHWITHEFPDLIADRIRAFAEGG
jgi:pimeloyl-ACP methyl ester carboxylesterase